ncbi:AAA family ATPase [Rhizobium tubonense]|uniref:AAA family ATPase n=1 Tax=Rhizobium tubonense TaxID=484088 RepID=A0A2W4CE35_9HYPH|nr:AAA family ATPase [Rhizobium tubonense]
MNSEIDVGDAASLIRSANRILVIGCSGGGKTTMSLQICKRLALPFVSMDRDFFWLPGWVNRPKTEERALIAAKVAEERWLMDGTGPSTFDLRLPRADVVIWVRMPRMVCMWGVISRVVKWYGHERLAMAPGCPERLDWQFLRYVWNFEQKEAPKVVAGLEQHGPDVPVFQLKTRRDIRALLDLLDASA